MFKKSLLKITISCCLIISIALFTFLIYVKANTPKSIFVLKSNINNDLVYDSHLYTGLDDLSKNYNLGNLKEDDKLIAKSNNGVFELYFNDKLTIFKVKNNTTGYIYASAIDEVKKTDSNQIYAGFLSSSFGINYYRFVEKDNTYNMNTEQSFINRAKTKRGDSDDGYYELSLNDKSKCVTTKIDGGLKLAMEFATAAQNNTGTVKNLQIGFNAYVTIDNDGLHVEVPSEEIYENTDEFKIASIFVMPLLGATKTNNYSKIKGSSVWLYAKASEIGLTKENISSYQVKDLKVTSNNEDVDVLVKNYHISELYDDTYGIYLELNRSLNQTSINNLNLTITNGVNDYQGIASFVGNNYHENQSLTLNPGVSKLTFVASGHNTAGYMAIPDGSGALIRYGQIKENEASQLTIPFYGENEGAKIQTLSTDASISEKKQLSAPIFGFVNGINQDGVCGIIKEGSLLANLNISPCGSRNIAYNFMYPTFIKRYTYNMYGISNITLIDKINNEDIKVDYRFLSGDQANYVGIARSYQNFLVDQNILTNKSSGKFNTQIDFLMSEAVKSLIGYNTVTMTSLKDARAIYDELYQNGITNQLITLKGWNKDGYSGSTPYVLKYNTSVGSKGKFIDFINDLKVDGNNVYLYNDYVIAYSGGDASSQRDGAKSNLKLRLNFSDQNKALFTSYFYMYPSSTLSLAKKNASKYQKLGAEGLALDSIGYRLFTYLSDENHSRYDAYSYYDEALDVLGNGYNLALIKPHFYALSHVDNYLNMTMYANSYSLYTDNVPLIPYVLKGYLDYYSDYVNFCANTDDAFLRMLDYGCFPSYILTSKISYELKYTNSTSLYTTNYDDWKETIVHGFNKYHEGYEATLNSVVENRTILAIGLVKVTYKNINSGKLTDIYINYTTNDLTVSGKTVPSKSFIVDGGL